MPPRKRIAVVASLAAVSLAALTVVQAQRGGRGAPDAPTLARSAAEERVLKVLAEMRRTGSTYLSVPEEDGRMLRLLTEAAGAKNVVEIGTSTGYSGLWFCLALLGTQGRLTTFEIDAGRAATARRHFEQAGVADRVTVIVGDAHQTVAKLKEPIDVVFLDADKEGYVDYLQKLRPLVRPGGLLLAHNVGMAGVDAYVREVARDPALDTVFHMQGGGLAITVKKHQP
jgi:predicted O-methyltransferase YrrM